MKQYITIFLIIKLVSSVDHIQNRKSIKNQFSQQNSKQQLIQQQQTMNHLRSLQTAQISNNGNNLFIDYSQFFGSASSANKRRTSFLQSFSKNTENDGKILQLKNINREFDGSNNNIKHPSWGKAGEPLIRKAPVKYQDSVSQPVPSKYSPRVISNKLGKMQTSQMLFQQNGKISMALTFWGQFIDHETSHTQQNQEQQMRIPIPQCDPYLDINCTGNQHIIFKRSKFTQNGSSRTMVNEITSWIDGSVIYGLSRQQANQLRSFQKGKMKTSQINLLPLTRENGFLLYRSGDSRVNQNIYLTIYHTIFMREHNRLCEQYANMFPQLNDEQLFTIARNYVTALIQKITFDDFLPLFLGKEGFQKIIGSYKSYDQQSNPSIAIQFSTAGFRVGHSLLVNRYLTINQNNVIENQLSLNQLFFRPHLLTNQSITKFLRGLRYIAAKKKNEKMIDQIRNLLITAPGSQQKLDLFSLNIQRSKDHGLNYYNNVRQSYGLQPITSFAQMTSDNETQRKLEQIYGSPDECDLWVGIIAQQSRQGAIMGQLGIQIVGEQFRRIRDGDSFWYENTFGEEMIKQIKQTSFEDLIARNTDLEKLNKNMFFVINFH